MNLLFELDLRYIYLRMRGVIRGLEVHALAGMMLLNVFFFSTFGSLGINKYTVHKDDRCWVLNWSKDVSMSE